LSVFCMVEKSCSNNCLRKLSAMVNIEGWLMVSDKVIDGQCSRSPLLCTRNAEKFNC
jgi:hypothetical protein